MLHLQAVNIRHAFKAMEGDKTVLARLVQFFAACVNAILQRARHMRDYRGAQLVFARAQRKLIGRLARKPHSPDNRINKPPLHLLQAGANLPTQRAIRAFFGVVIQRFNPRAPRGRDFSYIPNP